MLEFRSTGAELMSVFQALSAGKARRPCNDPFATAAADECAVEPPDEQAAQSESSISFRNQQRGPAERRER